MLLASVLFAARATASLQRHSDESGFSSEQLHQAVQELGVKVDVSVVQELLATCNKTGGFGMPPPCSAAWTLLDIIHLAQASTLEHARHGLQGLWTRMRQLRWTELLHSEVPIFAALHWISQRLAAVFPEMKLICPRELLVNFQRDVSTDVHDQSAFMQLQLDRQQDFVSAALDVFPEILRRPATDENMPLLPQILRCKVNYPTACMVDLLSQVRKANHLMKVYFTIQEALKSLQQMMDTWLPQEALASPWPFWLALHSLHEQVLAPPGFRKLLATMNQTDATSLQGDDYVKSSRVLHFLKNVQSYYAGGKSKGDLWTALEHTSLQAVKPTPFTLVDAGAYCRDGADCHTMDAFWLGRDSNGNTKVEFGGPCLVRVFGFEASRSNVEETLAWLEANLQQAELQCVSMLHAGLGDKVTHSELFGDRGIASMRWQNMLLYETSKHQGDQVSHPLSPTYLVQVVSLDFFMERHGISHIDFLKIDTEGAEYDILQGARKALMQHQIELVVVEYSHAWNQDFIRIIAERRAIPTPQHKLHMPHLQGLVSEMHSMGYSSYLLGDGWLPLHGEHWHPLYEVCRDSKSMAYGLTDGGWCLFEVAFVLDGPLQQYINSNLVWYPSGVPRASWF